MALPLLLKRNNNMPNCARCGKQTSGSEVWISDVSGDEVCEECYWFIEETEHEDMLW